MGGCHQFRQGAQDTRCDEPARQQGACQGGSSGEQEERSEQEKGRIDVGERFRHQQHADDRAVAHRYPVGIPAHSIDWRPDGKGFHPHVLPIYHRVVQNRWLTGKCGMGRLVTEGNARAVCREIPHPATGVQDLDHDAGVAIRVDDAHRQLARPVRWGSSQVIEHVDHSDARLCPDGAIHARVNGIGRQQQEQERKEPQGHGNE